MAGNIIYRNDNQLLEGLKSGNRDAFSILVEKYHVKVIRTCTGFVHSQADAEDLAQEVFIEVFRSVNKFRGDSELSTWIYRIAVNKSLNFLRSSARRRIFSFITGNNGQEVPLAPDIVAGDESNPDETMNRNDQAEALRKALASLPENQRTAFVLNKYEDMSYKEIADVMSISMGSVESLIFRAKQNLQKRLFAFYQKNMR
ncbi:MAG: RNA polymerase sigma factor [Bacteroidales bacterium]|nr:RNA polymerase sigma factor [Bacteroidales bacterium]